MPMPLDHTAIGAATCAVVLRNHQCLAQWRALLFIAILANLPDLDVLAGLVVNGNGHSFHRGVTHSLVFALAMGMIFSQASRVWDDLRGFGFTACFLAILSHVAADAILTASPVSLLWPLTIHHSTAHSTWTEVFSAVLLDPYRNAALLGVFGLFVFLNWRLERTKASPREHGTSGRQL